MWALHVKPMYVPMLNLYQFPWGTSGITCEAFGSTCETHTNVHVQITCETYVHFQPIHIPMGIHRKPLGQHVNPMHIPMSNQCQFHAKPHHTCDHMCFDTCEIHVVSLWGNPKETWFEVTSRLSLHWAFLIYSVSILKPHKGISSVSLTA